jgi:DNA-binding Xre family transcriptional regulator
MVACISYFKVFGLAIFCLSVRFTLQLSTYVEVVKMAISYKKLWKLLIDRDMKKKDLQKLAGISSATITKLGKNEYVSTEIIQKICTALECDVCDIMEMDGSKRN